MKNILNNKEYIEILNQIEHQDIYEYINVIEKEDKESEEIKDYLRNSLDFSFGLNIAAMCVEDILECMENKCLTLFVAKRKRNVDSYFYFLSNKDGILLFNRKELFAKELYVILYAYMNSKIEDRKDYSESAYAETICQLIELGYTLTFGEYKYTILTDNDNEVFFAVNLKRDNLNKIKSSNSINFYSEGFRDFEGVIIEDATDTFEIIYKLCEKHNNKICYIEDTKGMYGETEEDFFKSIK